MRIIHTGDIHLEALSEVFFPSKAVFHSAFSIHRWHTLQRLVDYANDHRIDLLLICGDLFHHCPTETALREVDALFASLTHTQVVLIAGNHDFLSADAPLASFSWTSQTYLLPSDPNAQLYLPSLNTVIHGFSYSTCQIHRKLCDLIKAPIDGQHHILMLHGGDADHLPLSFSALEQAGFDYVALGHIHKPQIFPGKRMAYCGSLEPLDQTETGNHGFMLVDIRKEDTLTSFIPFSHTRFVAFSLQISPEDTLFSLRRLLNERICRGLEGDFYLVTFTGSRMPELVLSHEVFSDLTQIVRLSDETSPWYDFPELLRSHGSDLIGQYILSFLSAVSSPEELDDTARQALYDGLHALLSTAADSSKLPH